MLQFNIYIYDDYINRVWYTDSDGAITGGDGKNIGTGDGSGARLLDLSLDGVDHIESSHWIGIRSSRLFSGETCRVVQ